MKFLKKVYFLHFYSGKVWRGAKSPYFCTVFFIVLDVRLTRLGYSGIPFFISIPKDKIADSCS